MTIGRLGRLPDPIPDRPVLMLPSRAEIALPVPPPAVDNNGLIKRYNNLGNLKYGDCVIAAIGHDCEVAYVASGLKTPASRAARRWTYTSASTPTSTRPIPADQATAAASARSRSMRSCATGSAVASRFASPRCRRT